MVLFFCWHKEFIALQAAAECFRLYIQVKGLNHLPELFGRDFRADDVNILQMKFIRQFPVPGYYDSLFCSGAGDHLAVVDMLKIKGIVASQTQSPGQFPHHIVGQKFEHAHYLFGQKI